MNFILNLEHLKFRQHRRVLWNWVLYVTILDLPEWGSLAIRHCYDLEKLFSKTQNINIFFFELQLQCFKTEINVLHFLCVQFKYQTLRRSISIFKRETPEGFFRSQGHVHVLQCEIALTVVIVVKLPVSSA